MLRATDMRDPRRTLKIGRRASRTAHDAERRYDNLYQFL
ncbi:DUF1534 domain-containing protein [Pseudomonas syringae pv. actinidiae]|nr:DUF1534 domain-containing protein [Pseudomonas syringae pv. actinidiae]